MSFWLFVGILRKWQHFELLYNGEVRRLITLGDLEFMNITIFEIAGEPSRIPEAIDSNQERYRGDKEGNEVKVFISNPMRATSDFEVLNYDCFCQLREILTCEFNGPFCKFSVYSHRKVADERFAEDKNPYKMDREEIVKIKEESLVVGQSGWCS